MSKAAYERCVSMDQEELDSYTIYLNGLRKDEKDISFAGLKLDDYTYEIDYSKKEIRINKKEKHESSSHPVIMPIFHY